MNSEDVLQQWAERSGEYSPDYYAYYGPNETSEQLRARLDELVGTEATVLEIGCSSGRHLAHLHDHGYDDLHGVDVNDEAFEVMADAYPDLFDAGTFHAEAIESAVRNFAADQFDAVYSVETLQHVHPDHDWVFDEFARITDDLLVTVENEDGEYGSAETESDQIRDGEDDQSDDRDVNYVNDEFPLYYRDWREVFTARGFEETAVESLDRDTFRTFRLATDPASTRRDRN